MNKPINLCLAPATRLRQIKTIREEHVFLAQHSQDHSDRIQNHEKRIAKLEVKTGGAV